MTKGYGSRPGKGLVSKHQIQLKGWGHSSTVECLHEVKGFNPSMSEMGRAAHTQAYGSVNSFNVHIIKYPQGISEELKTPGAPVENQYLSDPPWLTEL